MKPQRKDKQKEERQEVATPRKKQKERADREEYPEKEEYGRAYMDEFWGE